MAASTKLSWLICTNSLVKQSLFSHRSIPTWSYCIVRNRSFRYNYKSPHNYKPPGRPRSELDLYGPPEYPAVKPRWPPGSWDTLNCDLPDHACWKLHEKREDLRKVPTAKERLEKIAGEKEYLMWRVRPFELNASEPSVDFLQSITRTHLVRENGLPQVLKDAIGDIDKELTKVRGCVIDAILQEHECQYMYELTQGKLSQDLMSHRGFLARRQLKLIANVILSCLAADFDHLLSAQVDEDVRVESFWKSQGFGNLSGSGNHFHGIVNFQYEHLADWQLRSEIPAMPLVSAENEICTKGEYPSIEHSIRSMGLSKVKSRPISVSGHWIGDPCEFTPLSIHVLPTKIYDAFHETYGNDPIKVVDLKFGLTSAFGSCLAQAHNQGFNWLLDLTYPMTTQSVVTVDGSWFQFFTYQLNTLEMWKSREANNKCNILWMTDRIKLYDRVEKGQVKGFNDDALRMLLSCFLNKPVDLGVDLRPYLPDEGAPRNKRLFINHLGQEPLLHEKIERFQYPRNAVYF